ncbi:ATP-binding cassette superfamily [Corchorus olitorius]|uniref:ATP-binding cassette superfamily n=1 Tax=Corchorus olitorius TaxID=93759 RepID=A0A1R3JUD6_9ROSI|nr:ATP-binding cassette superfamily [Corchorus olitorius]
MAKAKQSMGEEMTWKLFHIHADAADPQKLKGKSPFLPLLTFPPK